jgi:hypothetical protein
VNLPPNAMPYPPERAYDVDEGQVIPADESRLARTIRQKKAFKEAKQNYRILDRLRADHARKKAFRQI